MSKGRAPRLNRFAHSMANYLRDTSGRVPDGGTCTIWDSGSHETLSADQVEQYLKLDEVVVKTGVPREIVERVGV
jgi:hypothetical protein